jgi:hypothetical protein
MLGCYLEESGWWMTRRVWMMNEPEQNYSLEAHHMLLLKFLQNLDRYKLINLYYWSQQLLKDEDVLKPCLKSGSDIQFYVGRNVMVNDMPVNVLESNYLWIQYYKTPKYQSIDARSL